MLLPPPNCSAVKGLAAGASAPLRYSGPSFANPQCVDVTTHDIKKQTAAWGEGEKCECVCVCCVSC